MKIQLPANMVEVYVYQRELTEVLDEMVAINKNIAAYNRVIKGFVENLDFSEVFYSLCRAENELNRRYMELSYRRRDLTNKIAQCRVD